MPSAPHRPPQGRLAARAPASAPCRAEPPGRRSAAYRAKLPQPPLRCIPCPPGRRRRRADPGRHLAPDRAPPPHGWSPPSPRQRKATAGRARAAARRCRTCPARRRPHGRCRRVPAKQRHHGHAWPRRPATSARRPHHPGRPPRRCRPTAARPRRRPDRPPPHCRSRRLRHPAARRRGRRAAGRCAPAPPGHRASCTRQLRN